MTRFIEYTTAIGQLVVAGYTVSWHNQCIWAWKTKDPADAENVAYGYRDGTTYRVKAETISDFIEGVA